MSEIMELVSDGRHRSLRKHLLSEQVVRLKGAPVERPQHGESTCLVRR
jgi:hypothetical protein